MEVLQIILRRSILGLKLGFRDRKTKWLLLLCGIITGLARLEYSTEKMKWDNSYPAPTRPFVVTDSTTLCLKLGLYIAINCMLSFQFVFAELFNEKNKKMISFLGSIGHDRLTLYSTYILNGIVVHLFLQFLFMVIMGGLYPGNQNILTIIPKLLVHSISYVFMMTTVAVMLESRDAIGFIMLVICTLPLSMAGLFYDSVIIKSLANFFPYVGYVTTMISGDHSFCVGEYLFVPVFTLLFVVVENISLNEFGYHHKNCILSKKTSTKIANAGVNISQASIPVKDIEEKLVEPEVDVLQVDSEAQPRSGRGAAARVMLDVKEVKKNFGDNVVLQGVTFQVDKGEILCLLGANGAGKSTLFNIILENIEQDSGDIGKAWGEKPVSYCPQTDMFWDHATVEDHLDFVKSVQIARGNIKFSDETFFNKVKEVCDLDSHWTKKSMDLSGGYKRRLTIAMALLANPEIILMDEPTTALDMEVRFSLMNGIFRMRDELGTTILYTTHHLEDAENFSDTICMLATGTIRLHGTMQSLRSKFDLATLSVTNITNEEQASQIKSYLASAFASNPRANVLPQTGANTVKFRFPYSSEDSSIINHIRHLEQTYPEAHVTLTQTSLEDVYLMGGDIEKYSSIEEVGRHDMEACWQRLIDCHKAPSVLQQFCQILRKNFIIARREAKHYGRILNIFLTPVLVVSIMWYVVLKPFVRDAQTQPNLDVIAKLLFLAAAEYSSTFIYPSSILMRMTDRESRITNFLFTANGSTLAYNLAGFVYDFFEKLTGLTLACWVIKIVLGAGFIIDFNDIGILLVFVLYDQTKQIIISQIPSFIFDKLETLQSYLLTLSSLLYSLLILTFAVPLLILYSSHLPGLVILSPTKIAANVIVHMMPRGWGPADQYFEESIKNYGGPAMWLLTLFLYYFMMVAIFMWIHNKKYAVKLKTEPAVGRELFADQHLKNLAELQQETNMLRDQKPQTQVFELEKTYDKKFTAVYGASFGVQEKTLFTLLGPNGAGKTSLLEVLCGILPRTGGVALFEQIDMDRYQNRSLSYCLQKNYLWEKLTFREHVEIVGRWRGIDEDTLAKFTADLDTGLLLDKNLDIQAVDLSGGNKRKLNTVLSLMAAPKILILDEPTAGMDPVSRRYFWNVLRGWKKVSNGCIILTTHTANEAEVDSFLNLGTI